MKKFAIMASLCLLVLISVFISMSGGEFWAVAIRDFEVVDDTMNINTIVYASAGLVRKVEVESKDDSMFLTFYATYGFNSSIGAKSNYTIDLEPDCDAIYVKKGEDKFVLCLSKNENGQWVKVK